MADEDRPSDPGSEFTFNLPHGVEDEDDPIPSPERSDEHDQITEHVAAHDEVDNNSHFGGQDEDDAERPKDDVADHSQVSSNSLFADRDDAERPMNYDNFKPGFSDDEGGDEAFDRSWVSHQARKAPKQKKSPRRSDNGDGDDEVSPRAKRPRQSQSLFGGPSNSSENEEHTSCAGSKTESALVPQTPAAGLGDDLSGMHLDQQRVQDGSHFNQQYAQDYRPFNVGFGLEYFDTSPAPSRAASEESVVIPPDDQPVYELRKNIDRSKAFTYIDTDKTGNYDPSDEVKQKAIRLQKARATKAAMKKIMSKGRAKKEPVDKLIVTLRFPNRMGEVRNITNDEDNWSDGHSDHDSDQERSRAETRNSYRHKTPEHEYTPQIPIPDPGNDVDDLTGYPAARGCKTCRKSELTCSIVEGGVYPCENCQDEDHVCELVLACPVKGGCKHCTDEDLACSFVHDPNQAICDQCQDAQQNCETLPPAGYKPQRTSIDAIMYSSDRKHAACTFCRMEKKRCSLKKKTDKPPCRNCKKNGIGCDFYDVPTEHTARVKKKAPLGPTEGDAPEVSKLSANDFTPEDLEFRDITDDTPYSREATPELEMEDEAGNKGMLRKIPTSFAHPIEFHTSCNDCNFCEMPIYGFVGYFERQVHVIQYYNGLGYTEVGGGHCENNGPTRMCAECTNTRLQIMCCPSHELERITPADAVVDFDALANDLMAAEPGSPEVRYQLQRWCSMCFSVATMGCGTSQGAVAGDDDEDIAGCGLRLCDVCASKLRDVHLWSFNTMADEMDLMPKTSEEDEQSGALPGKARADVGFLSERGLLMKCVSAGAGEAMEM